MAQRTSISDLLNPGIDTRRRESTLRAAGKAVPVKRDFERENKVGVRQTEAAVRERRQQENVSPEPFKLSRFKNVESRVAKMLDEEPVAADDGQTERNFLKAHEKTGGTTAIGTTTVRTSEATIPLKAAPVRKGSSRGGAASSTARRSSSAGASSYDGPSRSGNASAPPPSGTRTKRPLSKPPVPSAREKAQLAPRRDVDFLKSNAVEVIAAVPKSRDKGEDDPRLRSDYGRTPDYLLHRKVELAAAEAQRLAAMPDPDVPPGMMRMPESERLETLGVLEANKEEVLRELARLPIVIDTFGLKRRKTSLEDRLKEIEEGIKIFSRDTVFIDMEN